MAMMVFQNEKQSWEYAFLGYCRENGISQKYGKVGAQTLERATFVGIDDDKDEENNRTFLFDISTVKEFKTKKEESALDTVTEILIEGLNILPERAQWLIANCQFSLKIK